MHAGEWQKTKLRKKGDNSFISRKELRFYHTEGLNAGVRPVFQEDSSGDSIKNESQGDNQETKKNQLRAYCQEMMAAKAEQ